MLRNGFAPIWITTLEMHIYDTCQLHEDNNKEWYEHTTYRLQELNFRGRYVDVTYHLQQNNIMNKKISKFSEFPVYLVDGPGMCFASGRACPHALQTCCDTRHITLFFIWFSVLIAAFRSVHSSTVSASICFSPDNGVESFLPEITTGNCFLFLAFRTVAIFFFLFCFSFCWRHGIFSTTKYVSGWYFNASIEILGIFV